MEHTDQAHIHTLFEEKKYLELYACKAAALNEMLLIQTQEEFQDYLDYEDSLDEDIFWHYDSAVAGNSLLIGGYDEDVTDKVTAFLREKLPDTAFQLIQPQLHDIHMDLGTRETVEERINACNPLLAHTGYTLKLDYDNTYCDWAYFLSVEYSK